MYRFCIKFYQFKWNLNRSDPGDLKLWYACHWWENGSLWWFGGESDLHLDQVSLLVIYYDCYFFLLLSLSLI